MKVDFSKVTGSGFELLPAGEYLMHVLKIEKKESAAGNTKHSWTFMIDDGEFEGRRVFANTVMVDSAIWKLQQILNGFKYLMGLDLKSPDFDFEPFDYVGLSVIGKVTQVKGTDGVVRNEVDSTLPTEDE